MRSNGLLKWLMIPVALLVLFVAIRLFSGGSTSAPPAADAGAKLTPAEMKALGIEGDTPRDTVATLVAQVKQLRTELLRPAHRHRAFAHRWAFRSAGARRRTALG